MARNRTSAANRRQELREKEPDRTLKPTFVELPAYLVEQLRDHLQENREIRMRHLLMHGCAALGFEVLPEDLVAKRKLGTDS